MWPEYGVEKSFYVKGCPAVCTESLTSVHRLETHLTSSSSTQKKSSRTKWTTTLGNGAVVSSQLYSKTNWLNHQRQASSYKGIRSLPATLIHLLYSNKNNDMQSSTWGRNFDKLGEIPVVPWSSAVNRTRISYDESEIKKKTRSSVSPCPFWSFGSLITGTQNWL